MPPGEIQPYRDLESGLMVSPLAPSRAFELLDRLPCVVHLLPAFRSAAIAKFQSGVEPDTFLSGSNPAQGGSTNGMLLYSVECGRRGLVILSVKLLCVENLSGTTGRALVVPTAIMHKARSLRPSRTSSLPLARSSTSGAHFACPPH